MVTSLRLMSIGSRLRERLPVEDDVETQLIGQTANERFEIAVVVDHSQLFARREVLR